MLIKGKILNFHDAMKPLVYFNCFMGITLYRQPDTGKIQHLVMQLHMVSSTLVNWIITYIGWTEMKTFVGITYASVTIHAMLHILALTNSCIAITTSVLMWFRRKELADCVRGMPILDVTFEKVVGARNDYRRQYVRLIFKIIGIVLTMILVGFSDNQSSENYRASFLLEFCVSTTLHYPIIILLVLDLNFCTCVGYVEKKFRDLNNGLMNLVEQPPTPVSKGRLFVVPRNVVRPTRGDGIKKIEVAGTKVDELHALHEIRKAHLELCKLSRKINQAFGVQNLLSMGISFVMITGLLYTVYSAFVWEDITGDRVWLLISTIIWTVIYASKIWSVNHICSVVTNESDKTGQVIYELLKPGADGELRKEVQEFAVQMLQNPVRFNACGFFTLDNTFVQGVIGSITTYLVILIQMSPVPHPAASDSLANRTAM